MNKLLTPEEVAEVLRAKPSTVYDVARAGRIGCVRLGTGRGLVKFT